MLENRGSSCKIATRVEGGARDDCSTLGLDVEMHSLEACLLLCDNLLPQLARICLGSGVEHEVDRREKAENMGYQGSI